MLRNVPLLTCLDWLLLHWSKLFSSKLILWNVRPKQFCKPAIYSYHASQYGSSLLLVLSTSQFQSKHKTHLFHQSFPIVCFTHWRHFSGSVNQASGVRTSISIYFRCIILNHFIHLLQGLLKYTVSGNKPPPIYWYGIGWL